VGAGSYIYVIERLSTAATGTDKLFYRATGGIGADETSLGLVCCGGDYEIGLGQPITLNLSNLFSRHVTGITLVLDSIQSAKPGQVCDSLGLCAIISSSQDANAVSILKLYNEMKKNNSGLLTIRAGTGDILLNELQVATRAVPEPSGLLLMGTGLVLLAARFRRKLRA
jgi:hypothetical protein